MGNTRPPEGLSPLPAYILSWTAYPYVVSRPSSLATQAAVQDYLSGNTARDL
jgi:hypothetical protein